MEKRANGLIYTHHTDIVSARVNYGGAYRRGDLYGAYQPPSKRVAPYSVTMPDGRERRVYVMAHGNGGVAYVIVKGQDVILDSVTEDALARMHAASSLYGDALRHVLDSMPASVRPADVAAWPL